MATATLDRARISCLRNAGCCMPADKHSPWTRRIGGRGYVLAGGSSRAEVNEGKGDKPKTFNNKEFKLKEKKRRNAESFNHFWSHTTAGRRNPSRHPGAIVTRAAMRAATCSSGPPSKVPARGAERSSGHERGRALQTLSPRAPESKRPFKTQGIPPAWPPTGPPCLETGGITPSCHPAPETSRAQTASSLLHLQIHFEEKLNVTVLRKNSWPSPLRPKEQFRAGHPSAAKATE